jgi:eukaryotic-like serine/threonine-protein kinase
MAPHRFERRSLQRILVVTTTWIVVTAGATALGWRSVTFVTAQVTDQPSRPINATTPAPLRTNAAPPVTETTSSTFEDVSTSSTSTTTLPPSSPGDTTPPTSPSGPDSTRAIHGPKATPSTSGRREQPIQTPPSTSASTTKTISAVGGVTTVACSGNQIRLLSASPNPGFAVSVNGGDPQPTTQQVEVQYQSSNHHSDLAASCTGGRPVYTVNEGGGD